ncbi:Uncharacterised protein [uncultured archaeon]|nr:Uncharacterised protein [uncultured archaeon]
MLDEVHDFRVAFEFRTFHENQIIQFNLTGFDKMQIDLQILFGVLTPDTKKRLPLWWKVCVTDMLEFRRCIVHRKLPNITQNLGMKYPFLINKNAPI